MKILICSLALCAALEGLGFALAPGLMKKILLEMGELNPESLRYMGICALVISMILAFIGARLA